MSKDSWRALRASTAVWAFVLFGTTLVPAVADEIGPRLLIGGFFQQSTSLKTTSFPPVINGCAGNNIQCRWVFDRVPNGKQLIVTQVSCYLTVNPDVTPRFGNLFGVRADGAFLAFRNTHLNVVRPWPGEALINGQALHLYDSRQVPILEVAFGEQTQIGGNCTIAGQMIETPPS